MYNTVIQTREQTRRYGNDKLNQPGAKAPTTPKGKPMKKYTIRKNVTVDDETLQQWRELAQHFDTSESAVMRQFIREAYQKLQEKSREIQNLCTQIR